MSSITKSSNNISLCTFKIGPCETCGEKAFLRDKCLAHDREKCYLCGSSATHYCYESVHCKTPICDSQYCSYNHNIGKHYELTVGKH